jgi:hypothetical protein
VWLMLFFGTRVQHLGMSSCVRQRFSAEVFSRKVTKLK